MARRSGRSFISMDRERSDAERLLEDGELPGGFWPEPDQPTVPSLPQVAAAERGRAVASAVRAAYGGHMASAESPVNYLPSLARIAGGIPGGVLLGVLLSATNQALSTQPGWEFTERTGKAPSIVSPADNVAWRLGSSRAELHTVLTGLSKARLVHFRFVDAGGVQMLHLSMAQRLVDRLNAYTPSVTIAP